MSTTIPEHFIRQFESDTHVAYQRMGTKLRNTVRRKTRVAGEDVVFRTYGKGAAGQKSRHGNVPIMNVTHNTVVCTMEDWYAAEYVDLLDMLKAGDDQERMLAAQAGAAALGRKTDELITAALDGTPNVEVHGSAGMSKAKAYVAYEGLGANDVPDDGNRYWPVGPQQWTDLLDVAEFSDADYVGYDQLPFKSGMTAKRWLGFMFFTFTGLPLSGTTRKTFAYHTSALGHGIGEDITQDVSWVGEKQAHLVVNHMSQGSCRVDSDGIWEVQCTET